MNLISGAENLRKGGNSFANRFDLLMHACSFTCKQLALLTAKKTIKLKLDFEKVRTNKIQKRHVQESEVVQHECAKIEN